MIRVFQAYEYQEPADRGLNRPIKIRARSASGDDELIFVKTRLGYGGRPAAPGIELFCTLLAREIGLLAPEPVIVEIPPGFERLVFENPEFRDLIAGSHGRNFGTIALGTDWKTWPVGMSTRSFPKTTLENILTFDGLVQHTDRLGRQQGDTPHSPRSLSPL